MRFKEGIRRITHPAETRLQKEIGKNQVQRLIELGAPELLGVSPDEYVASMPAIRPLGRQDGKRYPFPLIVDPRISTEFLMGKLGITADQGVGDVSRYSNHPDTPIAPYSMWFELSESRSYRPGDVEGTVDELLGFIAQYYKGEMPFTIDAQGTQRNEDSRSSLRLISTLPTDYLNPTAGQRPHNLEFVANLSAIAGRGHVLRRLVRHPDITVAETPALRV